MVFGIRSKLALGAGSVFLSTLAMTGVAGASSASINTTGPGSVNIISAGHHGSYVSYSSNKHGSGWSSWHPDNWHQTDFEDWWGQVNDWADSEMDDDSWTNRHCDRSDWQPKNHDRWSDWNPSMWKNRKQSGKWWHGHVKAYLNEHHDEWRDSWHDKQRDGHESSSYVHVKMQSDSRDDRHGYRADDNDKDVKHEDNDRGNMSDDHDRGHNDQEKDYRSSRQKRAENNNHVSINNNTSQSARSGNVVVSHNTHTGDAWSGSASNNNSTSVNVHISD